MSVLLLSTEQFQRLFHSLVVAPSALFNLCVLHIKSSCIYIHRVIIILEEVIFVHKSLSCLKRYISVCAKASLQSGCEHEGFHYMEVLTYFSRACFAELER